MKSEKIRALVDSRWPQMAVASTQHLAAAGLESRLIKAATDDGVLLRLRRGAYVRRGYWDGVKPWDQDVLRILAHFESTAGDARYSHISAARLHNCDVWKVGPLIHVTTRYANSLASAGADVRTHRLPLEDHELATVRTSDGRDILTTSLERTVLDCARILPLDRAAVIGDHALRKGATLENLWKLLDGSPTRRGSRKAADLLDVLDARSESAGETRTRLLLRSFGLDSFTPQLEIPTRHGLFRADFADSQARVLIEFDGRGKYSDYKPAEEALLEERWRESSLQELGWAVFRVKWPQLERPVELRKRLFAFLELQKRPWPA